MTTARLLDLLILAGLLFILTRMLPATYRMAQLYFGVRRRRLQDGSAIAPPAPAAVAAVSEQLGRLGFRGIGQRTLVLPDGRRAFEWDLVDAATTTYAAVVPNHVVPGGALVICYSAFGDGAFVSTAYPIGATVRRPDLLTTAVETSLGDAVASHAAAIAAFAHQHGLPLPNRSMADLLDRDAAYRSRHGGATFRGRTYRFAVLTGVLLVAAAAALIRLVVLDS